MYFDAKPPKLKGKEASELQLAKPHCYWANSRRGDHLLNLVEDYAGGLVDLVESDSSSNGSKSQCYLEVGVGEEEDIVISNTVRSKRLRF